MYGGYVEIFGLLAHDGLEELLEHFDTVKCSEINFGYSFINQYVATRNLSYPSSWLQSFPICRNCAYVKTNEL
jgi:hypothetical protein